MGNRREKYTEQVVDHFGRQLDKGKQKVDEVVFALAVTACEHMDIRDLAEWARQVKSKDTDWEDEK